MNKRIISTSEQKVKLTDRKTGEVISDCLVQAEEEREFLPMEAPYVFVKQGEGWSNFSAPTKSVLLYLIDTLKPGGQLPRTRKLLAEELKMREQTVGKVFKELSEAGIIRLDRSGFVIDETKIYKRTRKQKSDKTSATYLKVVQT